MYTCCNISVTCILFSKVFCCCHLQHNSLMTDLKVASEIAVGILTEGSSHPGSITGVRDAFNKKGRLILSNTEEYLAGEQASRI